MKFKNLLATFIAALTVMSSIHGQSLKPGTVTFKNIHGTTASHNINTGVSEEITTDSLATEGFVIETEEDGYLDLIFSNGVVARLAPNSKVEIESFAVEGGRRNRDEKMVLSAARNAITSSTVSNLHLRIECGDIVVNATEKEEGELVVKTPTAAVNSDLTKFFVSHGKTNAESQSVSRAINLGTLPIEISTNMDGEFTNSFDQVAYGNYDAYAQLKSLTLESEDSAVVLSHEENHENGQPAPAAQPSNENGTGLLLATDAYAANSDQAQQHFEEEDCDRASYALLPYDPCLIERLGLIADHSLYGGTDPMGQVLVTAAAANSTYFNIATGEVGEVTAGMVLPEGTIIRSGGEGPVDVVFPNGAVMTVEPTTNAIVESISTQPVLSVPSSADQTNVTVRVESGRIKANTTGTPILDTFAVISPLDRHSIATDTVVSVEFLQMDTNAFQTVSTNRTPEGSSGINSVVVTSTELSFVSDNATFIEYAQDGNDLNFTTPPSYTHITESAIIPPEYDFIDRTIAFAAAAIPGPSNVGTPGNPGNVQRFTDEEDPVSP